MSMSSVVMVTAKWYILGSSITSSGCKDIALLFYICTIAYQPTSHSDIEGVVTFSEGVVTVFTVSQSHHDEPMHVACCCCYKSSTALL